MTLDASGRLGVGATSPGCPVDVRGSSGLGIRYLETSSGNTTRIELGTASGIGYINATAGSGSIALAINVADAERARIDSSGNLTVNTLAGSGSRTVTANASGTLSASSDSSLKQEIDAPIAGLAEILQVQPKAYKWLDDIEKRGDEATVELGFFADQVAPFISSAAPMGLDGKYGFYDRSMIAALVRAVQELSSKVDALQQK